MIPFLNLVLGSIRLSRSKALDRINRPDANSVKKSKSVVFALNGTIDTDAYQDRTALKAAIESDRISSGGQGSDANDQGRRSRGGVEEI